MVKIDACDINQNKNIKFWSVKIFNIIYNSLFKVTFVMVAQYYTFQGQFEPMHFQSTKPKELPKEVEQPNYFSKHSGASYHRCLVVVFPEHLQTLWNWNNFHVYLSLLKLCIALNF